MDVPPKVKHFLWRLCTNSLSTRSLLVGRHLLEDASCPWCINTLETAHHAIFECTRVAELWNELGCSAFARVSGQEEMCNVIEAWSNMDIKLMIKAATLASFIWWERNLKVFENKTTPNNVLVDRVIRSVHDHDKYAKQIYGLQRNKTTPSPRVWLRPPANSVKFNVDASLAVEGWVGLGVVARDNNGKVLLAATRRVRAWWNPTVAEAKALQMASRLARQFRFNNVIFETDCQTLSIKLSKAEIFFTDLDLILGDILYSCSGFSSCSWNHVSRDGNLVAHHLARLVPYGVEQVWIDSYPPELEPYVLSDFLVDE